VRAGCATWHFSAARVKLSSWQSVRKYLIWCISIATILAVALPDDRDLPRSARHSNGGNSISIARVRV
jgi:hypothetical protein